MDTSTALDHLKTLADQICGEATFLGDTARQAEVTLEQVEVWVDSVTEIQAHADYLSTVLDDLRIDLEDEEDEDED